MLSLKIQSEQHIFCTFVLCPSQWGSDLTGCQALLQYLSTANNNHTLSSFQDKHFSRCCTGHMAKSIIISYWLFITSTPFSYYAFCNLSALVWQQDGFRYPFSQQPAEDVCASQWLPADNSFAPVLNKICLNTYCCLELQHAVQHSQLSWATRQSTEYRSQIQWQ